MKVLKLFALIAIIAALSLFTMVSCGTTNNGGHDNQQQGSSDNIDTTKEYTVTFINDGIVKDTVQVKGGSTVERPDTPKKNGHTFGGWYCGETKWNFAADKVTSDITLEIRWIPDEISVVFDYEDGRRETVIVSYGDKLTLPETPTKENHIFAGWYNGLREWTESSEVKVNMTLTPKWTIASVTAKFDTAGGSSIPNQQVDYGTAITKPANPEKADHTFIGWYCDGKEWNFDTPISADTTLVARWRSDYFTVRFETDGGSEVAVQKVKYNEKAAEPETPTKDHYTFEGWYYGGKSWSFATPITENITLTAKWEKVYVTVTFDCNGGSAILPMTIHSGTTIISPTNTSRNDYTLAGWMLGDEDFKFSTPITSNITLTAKWLSVLESDWLAYKDIMPENTYNALIKLYEFYDGDKILDWMAGLWDSDVGAFYYSNSARDSYGYAPDIESTNQIIGWLTSNGVTTSSGLDKLLPNEIKLAIITFVKSMQSSSDGYFYHPQWPQGTANLQTDRYGRDLSWAESLLKKFTVDTNGDGVSEKQYPNYCTPGGMKCKLHSASGSCSFTTGASSISFAASGVTAPLSASSVSSAVSAVSSSVSAVASVSSQPDYSSSAAFTAWLEAYNSNIKNDSGRAHNINALQNEIIAKGYCDELLNYLDRIQTEIYNEQIKAGQTPTGVWQKPVNYRAVWGLLKYAPFYNNATYGREIKYAKEIVATAIKVIESAPVTDGSIYMNDLYNQWSSINSLITNVKKHNPEILEDIYDMLRKNAGSLIENSLLKITPYKNENGAFGYTVQGRSLTNIYGVPISLGLVESDVNATVLCCSMYRCIMTCLGYTAVPLCTASDGTRFVSKISDADSVKKYHTFTLGMEDTVSFEKLTDGGSLSIVTDPLDSKNSALYFHSVKTSASNSDRLKITPVSGKGNCYVFESDMYLASTSDNGYLFQIKMGNTYMITLHKNGDNVSVKETFTTSNSASNDLAETKTNTWFKLRVEYYNSTATGGTPKIKIFMNDEYVKTTSGYYGSSTGATPGTNYNVVSFYSMRSYKTDLYVDNCYFATEDRTYVDEDILREKTATVQKVYGGKDGIVVIVHDDGTDTTVNYMVEKFEENDLVGTIGLIGNKIASKGADGTWTLNPTKVQYWQSVLDTGRFDIANHSMTHKFWGISDEAESGYYLDSSGNLHEYSYEAGRITEEVVTSRDIMLDAFPGEDILAFIKPGFGRVSDANGTTGMTQISDKAYEIIESCHVGMRDTDGGVNSLPVTNILKVSSYVIRGSQTAEDWKGVVNQAIDNNGMLVFLFHTITESPSESSLTGKKSETNIFFDWLGEQKADGKVWNAFLDDAMRYTEEYKHSNLEIKEETGKITLSLTDDLDDSIYNHPLTVKVKVDFDASFVDAQHPDGTTQRLEILKKDGVPYVLVDIVPDSGDVVINIK